MRKPAFFFDFDNTLTDGDILDQVIERFSPDEAWRDRENDWEAGKISALECLRLQVGGLRVTREALFRDLLRVRIDPAFPALVRWARAEDVELRIVSDSFEPLIRHILANNGIDGLPVFANALAFDGDRLFPTFPHVHPAFPQAANAKAVHLGPFRDRHLVYAGDGRSDFDPALVADTVFAKSTLARELDRAGVAFLAFETIEPVLEWARARRWREAAPRLRAV